jgi:hypothetical protein
MNSKSKTVLKNIVKECLIEILAEGLVGNKKQATIRETRELRGAMQESYEREPNPAKSHPQQQKRSSFLDSIKTGIDSVSSEEKYNNSIQQKVKSITSDPIMSDILADTAMTTLREQKESNRQSGPSVMAGGDKAAKIVDQSSPEELFGGNSNKWANLAFASPVRK